MQQYIALIRAINAGGSSVIKMADLRRLFEEMGFQDVSTYIQTGNVLFKSDVDRDEIRAKLEQRLGVSVFILTPADLKDALSRNPFGESDDKQQVQFLFLSEVPDPPRTAKLKELEGDQYHFEVAGKVLYYRYSRDIIGRRKTIDFEKILGVTGTGRNQRVVQKLLELSAA